MANTQSAKKALRVSARKSSINRATRTKYKDEAKKVISLFEAGKVEEAKKLLGKAYSEFDKAAKNQVIKKNKAARLKSNLSRALNTSKKSKIRK